jgi:hypothetical protein
VAVDPRLAAAGVDDEVDAKQRRYLGVHGQPVDAVSGAEPNARFVDGLAGWVAGVGRCRERESQRKPGGGACQHDSATEAGREAWGAVLGHVGLNAAYTHQVMRQGGDEPAKPELGPATIADDITICRCS